MKTYDYNGTKVYLQKEEYRNSDTLAVLMLGENGESCGTITVNLDNPLQSEELAFLDENTFPGIQNGSERMDSETLPAVKPILDSAVVRFIRYSMKKTLRMMSDGLFIAV